MSSANRGGERQKFDLYETPKDPIERILERLQLKPTANLIDPCSGSGNILKVIKQYYPSMNICANELDPQHEESLSALHIPYKIKDFLQFTEEDVKFLTEGKSKFDYIFTNPPYAFAIEFIKKSLEFSDNVIMLLRLNFLESKKRNEFLKNNTPDVYVLSNRPSFINGATDSTAYAWFVWSAGGERSVGNLQILGLN